MKIENIFIFLLLIFASLYLIWHAGRYYENKRMIEKIQSYAYECENRQNPGRSCIDYRDMNKLLNLNRSN